MGLNRIEYLRWAKALPACRYRLCDSGVPEVSPDEFRLDAVKVRLDVQNPYGLPELIDALAARYGVSTDRVLPLAGASGANFVALGATLERGDQVVIEEPGYEPLIRAAEFLELRIVRARRDRERGFRFDLEEVERVLRRGPRAVVITDLHNPSGLRCPPEDLETLVRLTERHGARLIVDEVYLEYAALNRGAEAQPAALRGDHVLSTNSLTKVYGLGRLKAGWLLAAPPIIEKARDLLDHLCGSNAAPGEQLAVEALGRLAVLEDRTRRLYHVGRRVFQDWLAEREGISAVGDDGAVFAFPHIAGLADTRPLCETLAREYDTLIVPGAFFGAPQHVRISICRPPELVAEGLDRVGRAMDKARRG